MDFHVKTGARFLLRDKRLFEMSKAEITRVDYIYIYDQLSHVHVSMKVSLRIRGYGQYSYVE